MIMPEIVEIKARVVHATMEPKPEIVKILDWKGKFQTFILVDEICSPETPFSSPPQPRNREIDLSSEWGRQRIYPQPED